MLIHVKKMSIKHKWAAEIIEGILKYPWLLILVKISFKYVTLNIHRGIILNFLLHEDLNFCSYTHN